MFLSTGTRIYNLHHFAQFEVGPVSEQGIYPVRAYYPDSEQYETLYANTNIDHCWEYLHKLEHIVDAKEVDMHSTCAPARTPAPTNHKPTKSLPRLSKSSRSQRLTIPSIIPFLMTSINNQPPPVPSGAGGGGSTPHETASTVSARYR